MTEDDIRIIKKYPNRRLYDTVESKYITLPQVRDLIVNDVPFKVVDTQTDADITRSILLQIIIEQESDKDPLFSNENLEHFIRYYGENTGQGFSQFMEQSLQFFHDQQKAIESQMKEIIGANPLAFWTEMGEKNLDQWNKMQKEFFKAAGFPVKDENKKPK